ncbi:Hypothetical Protein FCC1311_098622 [Hondaea fermentalgiana]|uniref:TRP C-terminal domain-containing protein n=1 Tax=Hondaea fermentalgiana TaxID=2315210 RepID=A0A2R5GTI7_9STRA|nr:Hypothetical Protein FCC1311_098622 [Hondaea fermentalgiana]|eukprot:GBG33639.1 Hypothetical Protein FCC1311_098622 [Hondaea fermentalgiana]
MPTLAPTAQPTMLPTSNPTFTPTPQPTASSSATPTQETNTPSSAPTEDLCSDGVWDKTLNDESDADCGGNICTNRCAASQRCFEASDCADELACGYQAGESRGICLSLTVVDEVERYPECVPGLPCQASSSSSSSTDGICTLLQDGDAETGRCVPKQAFTELSTTEEEIYGWTPASVVATLLLLLLMILSAGSFDFFFFIQALDLGHAIASGAFLALPGAPTSYLAFASNMRWSMLAFLPLGSTRHDSEDQTSTSTRRALEDFTNLSWEDLGISQMAALADLDRQLMLCGFLLLMMLVMAMYALLQIALTRAADWRACVRESAVRIPYVMSYPCVAFAAYTLYLAFIVQDFSEISLKAVLSLLAISVLLLGVVWSVVCFRHTMPATPSKTFRSLHADWQPSKRLFWIARLLNNGFKGFFVGMVSQPAPIQAVLFLVVGLAYWFALYRWMPYSIALTNRIAIMAAILYVLNTMIPVVFAMDTPPFSSNTLKSLGSVQIALNILSLLFMLAIMVSQMYGRWREKRRAAEVLKAQEHPAEKASEDCSEDSNAGEQAVDGYLIEDLCEAPVAEVHDISWGVPPHRVPTASPLKTPAPSLRDLEARVDLA